MTMEENVATQKKGHEAAMSNFNKSKRELENLEMRRRHLLEEIERAKALPAQLAAQLATTEAELGTARAHFAAERAKVDAEHFLELETELGEVLAKLDSSGWTPSGESRVIEILSEFRLHRLSGQSSEAVRHYIELLKNPARPVDRRLRWAGLRAWVKSPAIEQAA